MHKHSTSNLRPKARQKLAQKESLKIDSEPDIEISLSDDEASERDQNNHTCQIDQNGKIPD